MFSKTVFSLEDFCGGILTLSPLCDAGEGGGRSLGSEARDQLRVQLHRVPVQPPGPAALPGPALHDRGSFPVPLCLAHGAPRHAR